jgi:DNA polymerase-3 subunit beta
MKVVLHKNVLLGLVKKVQGALSEKALAHIAIKTENNEITIFAADRIMAIYAHGQASTHKKGEAFVMAKLFSDIARELPEEEITLETNNSFLKIEAHGGSNFLMKLPLLGGLKWPEPLEIEKASQTVHLPTEKLSYMLEQAGFCIVQESPRNYGSVGFLHKINPKELRLVGTDGFRLSYCTLSLEGLPEDFLNKGISLSKRALNELLKLCYEGQEFVSFSLVEGGTKALAEVSGCQVCLLVSAVKYPNYRSVLPKKLTKRITVPRSVVQAMARRLLLAADKTRALLLSFSNENLKLSSRTIGSTEGHENIEIKGYTGGSCELVLNGKFLTEIFATAACDDLIISFSSADNAVSFSAASEPQGCLSEHILVPIRESKSE